MTITIFHSLKGSWKFARTIRHFSLEPHVAKQGDKTQIINVEGTASFNQITESEFYYQEKGILSISEGKQFNATRSYIYRFLGEQIQVYFDEKPPRLFHTLELIQDREAQASHICGEDLYQATYNFLGSEEFSLHYRVKGPRKNYEMATLYTQIILEA